ncbi:hypothetical protein GO755_04960 [Spirosoma sp. HMF4905]|uniref:Uncharacterized protein n=1 Tax=Spirosoma arboris TaxID=2682092 RepID=A0A7K1S6F3_9BACT|nr:hypothetical protein [Spirosoma arboris]MVM29374.1 hypothetical protein [Spirosoma arboris]
MKSAISVGDRVSIENTVKGFTRSRCEGVVIRWTSHGRLMIQLDGGQGKRAVMPEHVRKLADGPSQSPET